MHQRKYKTLIALSVAAALHTAGAYASSSPYLINNTSEKLSYSEGWVLKSNRGYGNVSNDVTRALKSGEIANFEFNGEDTLTLLSELSPQHGRADVFVDEINVGTIDLYSAQQHVQDEVFTFSNYPAGNHQVSIVTLDNTYFMLDALYVEPNRANALSFSSNDGDISEQGFSTSNSKSGIITTTDEGTLFSGINGRATATQALTTEQKAQAEKGYTISFDARVVSGSSNVVYLANNKHRFLPRLEIDSEGALVVQLEGGDNHTLVTTGGADSFHQYQIIFDAQTGLADFMFDGELIDTWAGASTSQSNLYFGNGSTGTDGEISINNVTLSVYADSYETPILDSDGDGVADEDDAFPLDGTESVDTDGDGIGNNADSDDDDDGMEDTAELINGSDPLISNLVDLTYNLTEDFTEITADDSDVVTDELFNQVSAKRSSYARFEWLSYLSDSANPEFIHYDADNGEAIYRDLDLQFRLQNMACDSYQLAVSYMRSSIYYTRSLKIDRVEDDLVIQAYKGIGSVAAIKTENYDLTTLPELSETIRIDGSQILLQQVGVTASCQGFDSDLDGLVDTVEQANNTDRLNSDTDGDGFSDSLEVGYALNPLDDSDGPTADSDNDGISNGDEADNGLDPMNDLDGAEYDSDGDGINNGDEILRGLDPLNSADAELDYDQDGTLNRDDQLPYDATETFDTDGDGIGNNSDDDDDDDGVLDVDDAYPLDNSESIAFAQEHYFDAMQETQISMNIEAQELSSITADVIAVELFDKNNFPQFNLDDLTFTQATDGQWTFTNNSAEPVSQLLISYNGDQLSLLEFTQQVDAFSQVSFDTPNHTLTDIAYQNQMKLFLPKIIFDGGLDTCDDPDTDLTKSCYANPNENDRTIYEKHVVNMHNSLNMVAFDTFISDFYDENCAEYTGECAVTKLPIASENLLRMGAEGHQQGLRVMRNKYSGEGVGSGYKPNIVDYSTPSTSGWASIWEGYITPESEKYRGYGGATYKTGFHEIAHAHGLSHASGMTYGMADAYPGFLDENVSEFEMEEMADKKVPQLFVAEQRNKDNKIQLNFYRLPDTSNSPVTIKLLSATEFSGRLALRNEQGNEVVLFMDNQPTGTIYIRSANDDSKYYSTVKIAAEDFIE